MGTYIKGMKPPKHCYDCDFNNGRVCFANEEKIFDITEEYAKRIKHPDCPLIEVKAPHGDLIDRGELQSRVSEEYRAWDDDYDALQILGDIEDAPTVIEAEVE